jgi:branched-chain amino acid aminotransferase
MTEKADKIWIDGALVDWDKAQIHLVSNTLHYGYGVFEGIRCYRTASGPAVFRLDEHLKRLSNSAKILGFELPYSQDALKRATLETIAANRFEQCYIRPIAYIGAGGMGLDPVDCAISVAIATWFWGEYVGEGALQRGVKVKTSSYARHHINTNMTKAKACGNYMLFQIARGEVRRLGYDEALLLDTNGHVAEGAVEHVFLVRDGALVTPPLTHLLDGITRDSVICLAREAGFAVREELFSRDFVYTADEVFFAGTGAEVTPVVAVDDRKIGAGTPGRVTKAIQTLYFDAVYGRSQPHLAWLTQVPNPVASAAATAEVGR